MLSTAYPLRVARRIMYDVEFTDEFESWWAHLDAQEQESIAYSVNVLAGRGPALGRPHVDTVRLSHFPNMKELRVQHAGKPMRIFFAFDPRRTAILLVGGNKTGHARFYEEMIPLADSIYQKHLTEIGERDGKEL